MSSSSSSSSSALLISSAALIEGHDDLLIEILLFLPTQSLVRFKVVSKRWHSLISDPSFCRRHTVHHLGHRCLPSETPPLFIINGHSSKYLVYNPITPRFSPFSFPLGLSEVRILQSCNGLLLLSCEEGDRRHHRSFHVFNPTTMQQRKLPPLPAGSSSIRGGIYYILVDPSLSSHYKVVVFSPLLAKKGTLTHLYDSETHNWNIGCQYKESVSTFCYGVYFNGSIYFLRLGVFSSYRLDPHGNLSRVANPIGIYTLSMQNQNFVTESNGALFFLALYIKKGIKCKLRVWEIKENGNKWNIVCKTNLQPVLDACGVGGYIVRSVGMGIIKGEELILPLPGKKIVICRLYDKGFELQDHNGQEFLQADKPEDLHRFFIQTLAPV